MLATRYPGRRRGLTAAWLAALFILVIPLLAACGDDDDPATPTPSPSAAASASPTQAITAPATTPPLTATPAPSAFPVTIENRLGRAVIEAEPQRIVALGITDVDGVIALGLNPVGIPRSPFSPDGVAPWLSGEVDTTRTTLVVMDTEIPIEDIAALAPDLILATSSPVPGVTIDEVYEQLSAIAPVVADVSGPMNDSWQDIMRRIGIALGREDEAAAVVAETEATIAAVRTDYPALVGKTYSFSIARSADAVLTITSDADFVSQFLQQLGLQLNPGLAGLAVPTIGLEQLSLLDADIIFMAYGSPAAKEGMEANPVFQQLNGVSGDDYIVLDIVTISAIRVPSALGLRWALAQIEPALARIAGA